MATRTRRTRKGRPTGLARNRGTTHNIVIGGKIYGAGRRGSRQSAIVADKIAHMESQSPQPRKSTRGKPYKRGDN